MKNILRKTQQKIYAIWQKAKQHISSFVGGQFKKRQYSDHRDFDWYYRVSWFDRKWFKHKVIRFIMNFVYKFTRKIDDLIFKATHETYFIEYVIFTNDDEFEIAFLPLIIECEQGRNIRYIVAEINEQLIIDFHYKVAYDKITKILDKKHRSEIENKIIDEYKNQNKVDFIGDVDFNTILRKNKPQINNLLPFNSDFDFSTDEILHNQKISFGVLKTNKRKGKYINKNVDYKIWIKYK